MQGGLFVCEKSSYHAHDVRDASRGLMSDITDAIGTAAEGGLFAKAVSGKTSSAADKDGTPIEKGHFAEGSCLNCGTELIGKHCHACGQKAHLHRTVGAFFHDLIHGALHLDGKIWRTLPLLVAKPGKLTRRYIDGERARFVSPMAMFLFSVFLMFAVFQAVGLTTPTDLPDAEAAEAIVSTAQETAEDQLSAARERAAQLPEGSPERLAADEDLAAAEDILGGFSGPETFELNDNSSFTFNGTGIQSIDDGIIKKWRENPGLMLYKLQANAYKFSWLLIPLSVPFVWLLFIWKRRFKTYDHAIFVTYSLAFVSLLFITLSVLATFGVGGGWVFAALAFIPPIHMYKHLKYTYGLSRFSTLWRLFILLSFEFVVLLLFLQILLMLGAF